jgi:hypothetical protein
VKSAAALLLLVLSAGGVTSTTAQCPWINKATAGGVLGVHGDRHAIASTVTGNSCSFEVAGSQGMERLLVHVIAFQQSPQLVRLYEKGCTSTPVWLSGIGNEAFACSVRSRAQLSNRVAGRVRDRAFEIELVHRATGVSAEKNLQGLAISAARQVAGNLY